MSEQPSEALQMLADEGVLAGPIEDHLAALSAPNLPSAMAIINCLARPDEAWPPLRALVEKAADGRWLSEDECTCLFRGLHVLGGGRDSAACAPLLRFLRRPPEQLEDLLGDAITENLSQIVAGVFDGDAEALFGLIADPTIDEYVRDAVLGAAAFLTWDGRISRALMIAFLVRFDDERLAPDGDYGWIGWLEAISLLGLRPLAPRVFRAWDEGRLPDRVLDRKDFEADLRRAEQEPDNTAGLEHNNLGYIEDVLAALEGFGVYESASPRDDAWPIGNAFEFRDPVINPLRHVGRNDPCPCGSGKKAKKCCLDT